MLSCTASTQPMTFFPGPNVRPGMVQTRDVSQVPVVEMPKKLKIIRLLVTMTSVADPDPHLKSSP